jgi:glycosyltransferase involved in cell wall biosynthesis
VQRILVISPFDIFPPYWGGANRIYNLVKYLSKQNKVTLLYNDLQQLKPIDVADDPLLTTENLQVCPVRSFTKWSQILNPLLLLRGLGLIRKESPSFILAEFAWSGLHALVLSFFTRVPYILDEHNIEFVRFVRMGRGSRLTAFLLRLYEKLSCKFARRVFCVSEVDREFLTSKLGVDRNKIVLIPNGIDTVKFYPNADKRREIRKGLDIRENTPLILFYGKLDYKPNLEAVQIIYREILPRVLEKSPETKFLIVGDNPPSAFRHKNMVFTGVADRIEDYINASDVVICPLLSGGGTRIKILESLSCGKIVISTQIGAEGLICVETKDFLRIVDDWSDFAQEIIKSAGDVHWTIPPQEFAEKYSWENIIRAVTA